MIFCETEQIIYTVYLYVHLCIILLKVPEESQWDAGLPVCTEKERDAGIRVHASSFGS